MSQSLVGFMAVIRTNCIRVGHYDRPGPAARADRPAAALPRNVQRIHECLVVPRLAGAFDFVLPEWNRIGGSTSSMVGKEWSYK